jgi:5-formyltetrahydrofolate cyclo-ligase
MDGTKRAIRQEMRRRRRALSVAVLSTAEEAVTAHVRALELYRAANIVLAYVATDNEVPTGVLIETAFADGKRVYLPRLVGNDMIFAEHQRGADLRPGAYGIPEPLGSSIGARAVVDAVALIPLLAFDASGSRVGRGGGHYDRTFAGSARPACLVGLGYSFQQYAALPREPWDLRLDWAVSERGAMRCWSGEDPSPSRKEGASHNDRLHSHGGGHRRAGHWVGLADRLPPSPTS